MKASLSKTPMNCHKKLELTEDVREVTKDVGEVT